ncbi:MAG TPA: hypothetical protein VFJ16_31235 [Longimicrobium sp.]|nr:hypothetical protein [Longimicrobium sp.]
MAQFSNELRVDQKPGYGDFQTWTAAINEAVSVQGASGTNPWTILGNRHPNPWTENLVVPAGLTLQGRGRAHTVIDGHVDIHGGVLMRDLRVFATTNPSAHSYGVRFINDTPGRSGFLHNVSVIIANTNASTTSCIQVEGSRTDALLQIDVCDFYANLKYTGANPGGSIRNALYRVMGDYQGVVQSWNTHHKSSTTATGTAVSTFILNEAVAPSSGFAYVHAEGGGWEDLYGGNGVTPAPVLLQSANTVHPGAWLDISFMSPYTDSDASFSPALNMAYAGSLYGVFYNRQMRKIRLWGGARLKHSPNDLPYYPSIMLDHAPTSADLAPEGTTADFI